MMFDEKTRFQIVALGLGIAAVAGYGIFRALDRPPAPLIPVQTAPAAEQATVSVSEPGKPYITIKGVNLVVAGTGGLETSVTGDPDLSYEWSIQGGTLEGDTQGTTVTWTAGAGVDLVISCKATNASGQSSVASMQVILRQPPAITRFEAVPSTVTEGSPVKLAWDATNTTILTLDPGGIDLTRFQGPAYETKLEQDTTFVLKATNPTGVIVTRELVVKVVPKPEIGSLRANPVAGAPEVFDVVGDFKGGKAELKNGATLLGAGEASPLTVRVSGIKEGASLTFTVTNEAGTYVSTSLSFSIPKK